MSTAKTTIMVTNGIKVVQVRFSITAFDIFPQIKIVNGEINKGIEFVFKVSAI